MEIQTVLLAIYSNPMFLSCLFNNFSLILMMDSHKRTTFHLFYNESCNTSSAYLPMPAFVQLRPSSVGHKKDSWWQDLMPHQRLTICGCLHPKSKTLQRINYQELLRPQELTAILSVTQGIKICLVVFKI